jgi:hypothetical protein
MALLRSGLVSEVRIINDPGNWADADAAWTACNDIVASKSSPASWTNLDLGIIITNVGSGTSFDLSDETLDMAAGYDKNCLQRHTIELQLYDLNAYLLLNDAMRNNQEIGLNVRWKDGQHSTWRGVRFTSIPILNPLPNVKNLRASASGTDVPSDPNYNEPDAWFNFGTVFNDGGASITANTQDDAQGLPLYSSVTLEHILQIDYAKWGASEGGDAAFEPGVLNSVALELTNDSFVTYNRIYTDIRRNNVVGRDVNRSTQLRVYNGAANLADLLTIPKQGVLSGSYPSTHRSGSGGTAPTVVDCLFGLQLSGATSGTDETVFYTEKNTP